MLCDLPKWWALLTYDGFKSHVNVPEVLETFAEESIKVGMEEAGTSTFNKAYDKLQVKQEESQTRKLLELAQWKVHVWINKWKLIIIIYTAIQNIPYKVWKYPLVYVNLHPHHCLYFSGLIKNIEPAIKTVEKGYFWNHERSYYDAISSVWKKTTVIK